ncbi:DnaJ domain-containing protein [Halobellus sp. GM3]|uniref:DnaJ domain-containing protein n=1 Tax=Halobellus sp. GM3 TaxID=3458410 RepID=UPI00403DB604
MDGDGLVVGITAVFAATTALFAVLGLVYQPFLLLFAAIFAAATYLLWYHVSGRLLARVERTTETAKERSRERANAASRGPRDFEGFGPGRRAAGDGGRFGRNRRASEAEQGGRRRRRSRGRSSAATELTVAEAYRTLGLDPGADEDAVRAAYRERAKAAHPDTDTGDEEQFKRVNRAYERLTN